MSRKTNEKTHRMLAAGSKLRNTETFRVTSNHDRETFLHNRQLAVQGGVTISEQMRQPRGVRARNQDGQGMAGNIPSVEGKNVGALLKMEMMGRKSIVVENLTLMSAGNSQS